MVTPTELSPCLHVSDQQEPKKKVIVFHTGSNSSVQLAMFHCISTHTCRKMTATVVGMCIYFLLQNFL